MYEPEELFNLAEILATDGLTVEHSEVVRVYGPLGGVTAHEIVFVLRGLTVGIRFSFVH
jgi:hypothetical protein